MALDEVEEGVGEVEEDVVAVLVIVAEAQKGVEQYYLCTNTCSSVYFLCFIGPDAISLPPCMRKNYGLNRD